MKANLPSATGRWIIAHEGVYNAFKNVKPGIPDPNKRITHHSIRGQVMETYETFGNAVSVKI